MRIVKLEMRRWTRTLSAAWRDARGATSERAGLFVRVTDDEGRVGLGEASPLPGFSTDTLEEATRALGELAKAPEITLDPCLPAPPQIVRQLVAQPLPPAARCGLEGALLDLVGRALRVSAGTLIRGAWPEERLPLQNVLAAGDGAADALAAALDAGFATFKLKLGTDAEAELGLARALRERAPEAKLRLDANGALSLRAATERLAPFAELGAEFVEEPAAELLVSSDDELAALGVPVGVDESLLTPAGLAFAEAGRAHALVLKPSALGGVMRCVILARRALARGQVVVVSHLLESPLGHSLAAELALALGTGPHGLAEQPGLKGWPAPPPQLRGAELVPQGWAGLGLDTGALWDAAGPA